MEIKTVEMHTGGEPLRIIVDGYPPLEGSTILEKRRYALEHLDEVRRMLMWEPRGHVDMYGAVLVEPDVPGADLAVLFMHNEGYSTMCGHGVIALGRYAVDHGLVAPSEPETRVVIQCPCGPVVAYTHVHAGRSGRVRFESVPAFAYALDHLVDVPGIGPVTLDIGYGGAFYALVQARRFGLDVRRSPVSDLVAAADRLTEAVRSSKPIEHPTDPDLSFLYGTILTDGGRGDTEPSANVCVFADSQVDRSPTGSGVTARLAVQYARDQVAAGQERTFESVTGARFAGRVVRETSVGDRPAVVVEVAGDAHYTGEAVYRVEPDDPLGHGFLLQ